MSSEPEVGESIRIADLFAPSFSALPAAGALEANPLTQPDALQDAQVLDVRFHAVSGVLGVLFELRQSLHFYGPDTAVLICQGVSNFTWSAPARDTGLTAWSVDTSVPASEPFRLDLAIRSAPGASMTIASANAIFVVGHVVGATEAPPDYTALTPDLEMPGVANWASGFVPTASTSTGSV